MNHPFLYRRAASCFKYNMNIVKQKAVKEKKVSRFLYPAVCVLPKPERDSIPLKKGTDAAYINSITGHILFKSARTPSLLLLTLLPLLLTRPLLLTFIALFSLLPGERSHSNLIPYIYSGRFQTMQSTDELPLLIV